MKRSDYKRTISKIKASESFKSNICELLKNELEKQNIRENSNMSLKKKTIYKIGAGIVACCTIAVGAIALTSNKAPNITPNKPLNTAIQQPSGKAVVNIEGIITEVSEDGNKIKVNNQWITITKDTELGITGPNAAPRDEQFFAEKFEVGNSISGFTLDDISKDEVVAYVIYTNWNWDKDN